MKALYLDGRGGLDVRLDGPRLRVRRPGRADGLFPLPRVKRVVSIGKVNWHPDAWIACFCEHKPLVILDTQGRFVRVVFKTAAPQFGLARHLGELLEVSRFLARYESWFQTAERTEMRAAQQRLAVSGSVWQPDLVWQTVCLEQYQRWGVPVGSCYRYLLGLAASQIASSLVLIGLPRHPEFWGRMEYRLFSDMVRLERWRQTVLLEQLLERRIGQPERWELTAAFEDMGDVRERQINEWRQCVLLEMMGLRGAEQKIAGFERRYPQKRRELKSAVAGLLYAGLNGPRTHSGTPTRRDLSSSVEILFGYLTFDRRMHESFGKA